MNNTYVKIFRIPVAVFTAAMIFAALFFGINIIISATNTHQLPPVDVAAEIYRNILRFIEASAMAATSAVVYKIISKFIQHETPFNPYTLKGLNTISIILFSSFILSMAIVILFPIISGYERSEFMGYFTQGTNMAVICVICLMSQIFDYGCKLQQESDETL